MRTYHSSVFPLRKTLLALTIGAITHSAAAESKKKRRNHGRSGRIRQRF
jgi:iron complex outermembrane receptor protein